MEFKQQAVYQELLNQIYNQEISKSNRELEVWTQYKAKHEKIIEGLQTISSELSLNCVVPIGKKALMKGTITHTNEILVCIGDGHFVKYSSQQAIALCKRRIKKSDEMLKKLEKERNLLELNQILPSNYGAFASGECKDLLEHWDEQKLSDWRVEHRKKEKEYRQKLMKLKQEKNNSLENNDDDNDFFEKLDQLELEEDLNNELNRPDEEEAFQHSKENIVFNNLNAESLDKFEQAREEVEETNKVEVNLKEQLSDVKNEEKKDAIVSNESYSNKCTPVIDAKKETNFPQTSQAKKHRKRRSAEKSVKDTKINGKFEVSIIKEEDLEKPLQRPKWHSSSTSSVPVESSNNNKKRKSLGRRVSFAEPYYDNEKTKCKNDTNGQYEQVDLESNNLDPTNKDTDDVIKIDFVHSETETSVVEGTDGEILSPKDIYKVFCKPKSILKKTSGEININYNNFNISTIDENDEAENSENLEENSFNDDEKISTYNFVVHDIQEKKVEEKLFNVSESAQPIIQDTQERKVDENISSVSKSYSTQKPMSRFKMERANLKK